MCCGRETTLTHFSGVSRHRGEFVALHAACIKHHACHRSSPYGVHDCGYKEKKQLMDVRENTSCMFWQASNTLLHSSSLRPQLRSRHQKQCHTSLVRMSYVTDTFYGNYKYRTPCKLKLLTPHITVAFTCTWNPRPLLFTLNIHPFFPIFSPCAWPLSPSSCFFPWIGHRDICQLGPPFRWCRWVAWLATTAEAWSRRIVVSILCVWDSYWISWVNVDKREENICMAVFYWSDLYWYCQILHEYS